MRKFACVFLCLFLGTVTAQLPELNKHSPFDVDCESCHTDNLSSAPSAAACIDCHGDYKDVAVLTKRHEYNPHALHSPYDEELSCTDCHAMHKASYNLCEICHDVDYNVP